MEVWKDIKGYEGLYQVSSLGRVKRLAGYKRRNGGKEKRYFEERFFTGRGKRLYKRAELWKDGKGEFFYIHRLVAAAFIRKPEGKDFINHIDADPSNNKVENLEWCTLKENNHHAISLNLYSSYHNVKLTRKRDGETFYFKTKRDASAFLGKSHTTVGHNMKVGINPTDINGDEYIAERGDDIDGKKKIQNK